MTAERADEQHDCNQCHGVGEMACVDGCHTIECDERGGSGGRLWSEDSPVRPNEVEYRG